MAFPYNGFTGSNPYYPTAYPQYGYQQTVQPMQPISPAQSGQPQTVQQQTAQTLTPPVIHTDIIQVQDRQAVVDYPLAVGVSQMFMTRDEKAIYVKSTYANSEPTITDYIRKAPEPIRTAPEIDLHNYVTWDSLEKRLSELIMPHSEQQKPKKKGGDE